jgi:hypothetical protein
MHLSAMYGLAFLILLLLPLFGWWLIRNSRSSDRLAKVVNESGVDLGFLSFKGKTSALLLFSDIRFVLWLVRRKYKNIDLPADITKALDDARRDYILGCTASALIVITGFSIALINRIG